MGRLPIGRDVITGLTIFSQIPFYTRNSLTNKYADTRHSHMADTRSWSIPMYKPHLGQGLILQEK